MLLSGSYFKYLGAILFASAPHLASALPNFIIFQPDDYQRYEEWDPPAHVNSMADALVNYLNANLTWIEQLRLGGVSLSRQYTASPACGTSRYSTVTGRYPSRSAYGKNRWDGDIGDVLIKDVKLVDTNTMKDCSEDNVAAVLSQNGYRTGIVGKWHISPISEASYTYEGLQTEINGCGFTFAEAVYAENLDSNIFPGDFNHNMEYVTDKGIDFIDEAVGAGEPFFLYFNPTVPHGMGDVSDALTNYSCLNTPEGILLAEPDVPYMTEGTDCETYRASVVERAGPDASDTELGAMWVDDAIGALYQRLEEHGELNNTFFMFQQDHGQEGKASLYEPGIRMSSFVHYPDAFQAGGVFTGLTTSIDIAPTVMELAGLDENSPGMYEMDGQSWASAVTGLTDEMDDRCIFSEYEFDRTIVCKCDKLLAVHIIDESSTLRKGSGWGLYSEDENTIFFDLCDDNDDYVISPMDSPEINAVVEDKAFYDELELAMLCHLNRTDPGVRGNRVNYTISCDPTSSIECPTARSTPSSSFFGATCGGGGGGGGGGDGEAPVDPPVDCPE